VPLFDETCRCVAAPREISTEHDSQRTPFDEPRRERAVVAHHEQRHVRPLRESLDVTTELPDARRTSPERTDDDQIDPFGLCDFEQRLIRRAILDTGTYVGAVPSRTLCCALEQLCDCDVLRQIALFHRGVLCGVHEMECCLETNCKTRGNVHGAICRFREVGPA
jgi:hypothetical protein